jgi:hypothetical protein
MNEQFVDFSQLTDTQKANFERFRNNTGVDFGTGAIMQSLVENGLILDAGLTLSDFAELAQTHGINSQQLIEIHSQKNCSISKRMPSDPLEQEVITDPIIGKAQTTNNFPNNCWQCKRGVNSITEGNRAKCLTGWNLAKNVNIDVPKEIPIVLQIAYDPLLPTHREIMDNTDSLAQRNAFRKGVDYKSIITFSEVERLIWSFYPDTETLKNFKRLFRLPKNEASSNLFVNTRILQGGLNYIHLLQTLRIGNQIDRSVTAISRGAIDTHIGKGLIEDFNALSILKDTIEIHSKSLNGMLNSVDPVFAGDFEYNGHKYPYYTTGLIENAGEVNIYYDISTGGYTFQHPLGNETPNANLSNIISKNLSMRDPRYFWNSLKNIMDSFTLIWKLTGGYFPRDPKINAGDFLANIDANGMNTITLATFRGGAEKISRRELFTRLYDHLETPIDSIDNHSIKIFAALSEILDYSPEDSLRNAEKLV